MWTGELVNSKGETISRELPVNRAGQLFVRNGAIVPTAPVKDFVGTEPLKDLIIKVYPHGDSSFTLYDDDGESYAYEEGAISSTLFECHQKGTGFTVTVHPAEGSYEGMPQTRSYGFELRCTAKPRKVSLNGTPVKDWSWEDQTLKVNAGDSSIHQTLTLTVQ